MLSQDSAQFEKTGSFLREKTIADLLKDRSSRTEMEYMEARLRPQKLGKPIIAVDEATPVTEVLRLCGEHSILALPTFRVSGGLKSYTAMITVADCVYYALLKPAFDEIDPLSNDLLSSDEGRDKLRKWMETRRDLLHVPVKEVVESMHGGETVALRVLKTTDSVWALIEEFGPSKAGHRVLCYDPKHTHDDNYLTIITQTDVIWWLSTNRDSLDASLFKSAISGFNQAATMINAHDHASGRPEFAQSGLHFLVSVNEHTPAILAARMMYLYGVSCVAIVDEQGRIAGNLSAADFRGFDETKIWTLLAPVLQFIQTNSGGDEPLKWNMMVSKEDSFESVTMSMMKRRLHRAWICEDHRPVGITTFSDIISGLYERLHPVSAH